MKYGYFNDNDKEYIITTPKTPLPWINYLGCENFFRLISNTSGGYSFYKDAKLLRLTRYRYNNAPLDSNGHYFYIKDGADLWNPGWQPVQAELESYTCRHGLGYTIINSERCGINCEVTTMVPLGDNCELNKVTIKNTSSEIKTFSLYSYIEFCLWNAVDDLNNFQRNYSTGEVEVQACNMMGISGKGLYPVLTNVHMESASTDNASNTSTASNTSNVSMYRSSLTDNTEDSFIYHKSEYRERRNHYAVYSVNAPVNGFDTSRDSFLGVYGSPARPEVIMNGTSGCSVASGWAPIGSYRIDITLEPGEECSYIFNLGYVENPDDEKWELPGIINKKRAIQMVSRYNSVVKFDEAFKELKAHWNNLLSTYILDTADEKLCRMVNIWNQYQCMVTFNMSRSASYFESGTGRGMGFRDSCQDLLGFVHLIPELARQRLLDIAATQFENGSAYHQYQPLTKKGNADIGSGFNDDPLWLIAGTAAYIKETGDYSILDEMTAFDCDESKAAPFMEHLRRSFEYTTTHLGPHKLPLIGRADWNDCLNLNCFSTTPGESFQTTGESSGPVAESVFIAGMYVKYGREFAAICSNTGHADEAAAATANVEKMYQAVLDAGWDGEWFLRAYDAAGEKVGSNDCDEGKIYIEPQGFCVMAGIGVKEGHADRALNSVKNILDTKYGIVLLQPPYSEYRTNLGEVSSYPGGYKENAGIFCHNNPWISIAETVVGHGNRAFEVYKRICPAYIEDISEIHRTEPYVYSQMIAGKDADHFGEAKNSWLTGTAAWTFTNISQYILGVRAEYDGLCVDPCIPDDLTDLTITRVFRGATYKIHIENHNKGSKGLKSLTANGVSIDGSIIPYDPAVTEYEVTAIM